MVFSLLALLARCLGSTLQGGLVRFGELVLFLVMMMQTLAEVGQASSAPQPPLLRPIYAGIAAFQLSAGITIHQNCLTGLPPFLGDALLLAFGIVCSVILMAAAALKQRVKATAAKSENAPDAVSGPCTRVAASVWLQRCIQRSAGRSVCSRPCSSDSKGYSTGDGVNSKRDAARGVRGMGRGLTFALCFALSVAYARSCNTVFTLLHCSTTRIPADLAASMNGVSVKLLSAADSSGLVDVLQLQSAPSFMCYRGAHAFPAALAWIAAVVYLLGFPVWSLVRTLRFVRAYRLQLPSNKRVDVRAGGASEGFVASDPAVDFFARTTYRPPRFFYRHIELVAVVILAALLVFWQYPQSTGAYAAKAAVTCLLLLALACSLLTLRPHYTDDAWRVPVLIGSQAISAIVAVMNALLGARHQQLLLSGESSSSSSGSASSSSASSNDSSGGSSDSEAVFSTSAIEGVSYLLVAATAVWLAVLLGSVGRSLVKGARAEGRLRALQERMAAAAAAAAKSGKAGKTAKAAKGSKSKDSDPLEVRGHAVDGQHPGSFHLSVDGQHEAGVGSGRIWVKPTGRRPSGSSVSGRRTSSLGMQPSAAAGAAERNRAGVQDDGTGGAHSRIAVALGTGPHELRTSRNPDEGGKSRLQGAVFAAAAAAQFSGDSNSKTKPGDGTTMRAAAADSLAAGYGYRPKLDSTLGHDGDADGDGSRTRALPVPLALRRDLGLHGTSTSGHGGGDILQFAVRNPLVAAAAAAAGANAGAVARSLAPSSVSSFAPASVPNSAVASPSAKNHRSPLPTSTSASTSAVAARAVEVRRLSRVSLSASSAAAAAGGRRSSRISITGTGNAGASSAASARQLQRSSLRPASFGARRVGPVVPVASTADGMAGTISTVTMPPVLPALQTPVILPAVTATLPPAPPKPAGASIMTIRMGRLDAASSDPLLIPAALPAAIPGAPAQSPLPRTPQAHSTTTGSLDMLQVGSAAYSGISLRAPAPPPLALPALIRVGGNLTDAHASATGGSCSNPLTASQFPTLSQARPQPLLRRSVVQRSTGPSPSPSPAVIPLRSVGPPLDAAAIGGAS